MSSNLWGYILWNRVYQDSPPPLWGTWETDRGTPVCLVKVLNGKKTQCVLIWYNVGWTQLIFFNISGGSERIRLETSDKDLGNKKIKSYSTGTVKWKSEPWGWFHILPMAISASWVQLVCLHSVSSWPGWLYIVLECDRPVYMGHSSCWVYISLYVHMQTMVYYNRRKNKWQNNP